MSTNGRLSDPDFTGFLEPVQDEVNLALLRTRTVVIVGVGTTGSQMARELANYGVGRFVLADGDSLEARNCPRHALTIEHVGMNKAVGMAKYLKKNAPVLYAEPMPFHIDGDLTDAQVDHLFRTAHLIVAAPDDRRAQRRVAERALVADVPCVVPNLYEGGGGEVFVQFGQGDPCFLCWDRPRREDRVLRGVPGGNVRWAPIVALATQLSLGILDEGSEFAEEFIVRGSNTLSRQIFVQAEPWATVVGDVWHLERDCPACALVIQPDPELVPATHPLTFPFDSPEVLDAFERWAMEQHLPSDSPDVLDRFERRASQHRASASTIPRPQVATATAAPPTRPRRPPRPSSAPPQTRTVTAPPSPRDTAWYMAALILAVCLGFGLWALASQPGGQHGATAAAASPPAASAPPSRPSLAAQADARIAGLSFQCLEMAFCDAVPSGSHVPLFIDGMDANLADYLYAHGYSDVWAGNGRYFADGSGMFVAQEQFLTRGAVPDAELNYDDGNGNGGFAYISSNRDSGLMPNVSGYGVLANASPGEWMKIAWLLLDPSGEPVQKLTFAIKVYACDNACQATLTSPVVGQFDAVYPANRYAPPPLFPHR
jgi:ThiF family protein